MQLADFVIIGIIGAALYLLYKNEESKQTPKLPISESDFVAPKEKKFYPQSFAQKNGKYFTTAAGKKYPYKVDLLANPDDIDPVTTQQYHPDYVEVLSVLNKLSKGTVFNKATLPVIMVTEGDKKDVFVIANRFVFDLGRKAGVTLKMLDVINIKKFVTEDQEKVRFDLVIQKETPLPTKIKMLLRVSIVYNTDNVVDETNFFDQVWSTKSSKKPILDEAFVLGYSSGYFDIESQAQTEYYAFRDVDDSNFIDEGTVNNIVRSVRRKHALETGCIDVAWSEDGRDYWVKDLSASNWGNVDRRGQQADFSKMPKPCSSNESDQLYGAIGTKIIDP